MHLSTNWLIAKWLYYNEFTDLTKEECALMLPDFTNSITRPIDDCSMCANLTEIKRIQRITKEEFLASYAYTGVPVIITDAINDWSGLNKFNFNFFKDLYLNLDEIEYKKRQSKKEIHKDKSSAIMETFNSIIESDNERANSKITCQFFPYKTKFQNLQQVFEMDERDDGVWEKPWYVGWSNCNNYASKILRKHYKRPYFLPDESEMSRVDWIFMGTPGYGAGLHIDDVNNPTWQAQISGIKLWTFKPPAECLLKCPFSLTAEVNPGEIIIFDSNRWFHSTVIKGEDLSVAICSEQFDTNELIILSDYIRYINNNYGSDPSVFLEFLKELKIEKEIKSEPIKNEPLKRENLNDSISNSIKSEPTSDSSFSQNFRTRRARQINEKNDLCEVCELRKTHLSIDEHAICNRCRLFVPRGFSNRYNREKYTCNNNNNCFKTQNFFKCRKCRLERCIQLRIGFL
ncbi:unnamed protein product [Brachionus calyciflorus]|uniref:Nuclear receptor domain-containing protein n=1 Tax=Brachionus calyciflorus TaxID=104777 RepID=A0A813UYP8_9BILA|nr:unnamed protein product [Brachionus calyciflorus]